MSGNFCDGSQTLAKSGVRRDRPYLFQTRRLSYRFNAALKSSGQSAPAFKFINLMQFRVEFDRALANACRNLPALAVLSEVQSAKPGKLKPFINFTIERKAWI